ncbi:MAG: WG repeat-containing protein [Candidatus Obscuribacter sp.]|nr:WG repeat-containing protein [Candidatus Obscuribacter sp.]
MTAVWPVCRWSLTISIAKWGFIDLAGEPKIEAKYENVKPFSEGFAGVSQLGKWGFIDKTGKQITDLKFDQVSPFRDRVAEGYFGSDFVIIGDIGTISMSDPLQSRSTFHDGLGLSRKKGKYGFMNKAGKTVIKRRFTYAEDFSEGLAVVGVANARRGFINVTGELVIPPVFDEAFSFTDKLAGVKIDPRLVGDDGSISASAIEDAKKNPTLTPLWSSPPALQCRPTGTEARYSHWQALILPLAPAMHQLVSKTTKSQEKKMLPKPMMLRAKAMPKPMIRQRLKSKLNPRLKVTLKLIVKPRPKLNLQK